MYKLNLNSNTVTRIIDGAGTTSAASIPLISESAVAATIKFIAIGRWF